MEENILKELLKLSSKAIKNGEVPIAAIIVRDGKIISKAYNKKETKKNPLMHAEVVALIKATKKLKNWRLNKCEMYVSLEPCEMCKKIINESRIKNVHYLCSKSSVKSEKTNFIKFEVDNSNIYAQTLKNFFKNKRNSI